MWPTCTPTACSGSAICSTRSDRGHVDLPRLIEGHYALQVFSSVTKSPAGQNYDANGADSDTITGLVKIQQQPETNLDLAAAAFALACAKNCATSPTRPTASFA